LPFDVDLSVHPKAKSRVASDILKRLKEDVANYTHEQNNAKETRLAGGFSSLEECARLVDENSGGASGGGGGGGGGASGGGGGGASTLAALRFLTGLQTTLRQASFRDQTFMQRATRSLMRLANHVDPNPPGRRYV
jgi:hypothetical protein